MKLFRWIRKLAWAISLVLSIGAASASDPSVRFGPVASTRLDLPDRAFPSKDHVLRSLHPGIWDRSGILYLDVDFPDIRMFSLDGTVQVDLANVNGHIYLDALHVFSDEERIRLEAIDRKVSTAETVQYIAVPAAILSSFAMLGVIFAAAANERYGSNMERNLTLSFLGIGFGLAGAATSIGMTVSAKRDLNEVINLHNRERNRQSGPLLRD